MDDQILTLLRQDWYVFNIAKYLQIDIEKVKRIKRQYHIRNMEDVEKDLFRVNFN